MSHDWQERMRPGIWGWGNSARGAILWGLGFAVETAIITLESWYWPANVCYCFSLPEDAID